MRTQHDSRGEVIFSKKIDPLKEVKAIPHNCRFQISKKIVSQKVKF